MKFADPVISSGKDTVGPTIFLPQREFWNPGAINWNPNKPDPSDFELWTAVYDVSGVSEVTLNLRVSAGQKTPLPSNMIYSGGTWTTVSMTAVPLTGKLAPQTVPLPMYIADLYIANITGISQSLIDFYVSASDGVGNGNSSPIQHVYVANSIPRE